MHCIYQSPHAINLELQIVLTRKGLPAAAIEASAYADVAVVPCQRMRTSNPHHNNEKWRITTN